VQLKFKISNGSLKVDHSAKWHITGISAAYRQCIKNYYS